MKIWQEDQLSSLSNLSSEQEIFEEVKRLAANLGFDYCAYGIRIPLAIAEPKIVMLNNYSEDWQRTYAEKNYFMVDPTVQHCMHSLQPIILSDPLFSSARDLWEDATSYGLHHGWVQSCRDANGAQGMLTLARSNESISDSEMKSNYLEMFWLAQTAHIAISKMVHDKHIPESHAQLTRREVEVLRWTAEGKTSYEISFILNASERTINFHIANSMQKLNATNKISATVKAALLGFL